MEGSIGRELLPEENVHHLNGVRDDNRLENLELWSSSQPSGQRVADKVAWAENLLRLYAPEKLKDKARQLSELVRDPRIVEELLGGQPIHV